MRHADRQLNTLSDLVTALRDFNAANSILWYRGQGKADWKLVPFLGRDPAHLAAEMTAIKVFKQNSRPYLASQPGSEWEWIFLMQHHRAPTRLLDWTESPLAALFFAIADRDGIHRGDDAALWFLDPIALNHQAGHRRLFDKEILAFDIDKELEEYLPERVNAKLARPDPVAAIGPRNSARMVAQAGTFTIMHAEIKAIEEVGAVDHVWRMVIPAAARPGLQEELSLLGISELTLFPDLDRVADIARKLLP